MQRKIIVPLVIVVAVAGVAAASLRLWPDSERSVTTTSDEAYVAYEEGMDALGRFRLSEADSAFAVATDLDPEFAMAYVRRAQVRMSYSDVDSAMVFAKQAYDVRDNVSEIERLWIERNHAAYNKDREKADEIYQQLLAEHGDHPWVLRLRAEFDKLDGRYDDAQQAYDRILELEPESVDIHNLKGYLFLAMGEYDKAVQSLQRYAFYAPEQANPHDSLGEAFLYSGQYEEAAKEFVRALELDQGFVWSAIHLADALSVMGQIDRAHAVLDRTEPLFVERNLTTWLASQRLLIDMRGERWNDILRSSETLLAERDGEDEPNEMTVMLHFVRTMALLEVGDLEGATSAAEELEKSHDTVMENLSQYATARDNARLNEALVKARFARAYGTPEKGIEELRTAIDESKLGPHLLSLYRYELVESLLAADDAQGATEVAEAHLARIPRAPLMNLVAAKAHLRLGVPDQAIEHLQAYLEVMRNADKDLPRLAEAKRMAQKLFPRS